LNAQTHIIVDWPQLLAALHVTHRMTLLDIATVTGQHRDSIRNYYNRATRPSHATGEQLIELWIATTGKPRAQLPMEPALPSVARVRGV
jgi:myo-inositol catabolism protein IolC